MLGWKDSDGDGILDVFDVPLTLTGSGQYNAAQSRYEFTGSSAVQTLTNQNPRGAHHNITLNKVDKIQYRLDGGAWTDGNAYGLYSTDVAQNVTIATGGAHTIDFRTVSAENGMASNLWSDSFTASGDNSPPAISSQTFTVTEHSPVNTVVGTVMATDPDAPPQTLTYSITAGNSAGVFAIDAATGRITVADQLKLNYEQTTSFPLTVQVADSNSPPATASATITVNLTNVTPTIVVGDLKLKPNLAGQVRQILVSGGDYVAGLTFNIRVGNGLNPANAPKITGVDILGTAGQPAIFYGNNTGQVDPDGASDSYPYFETRQTTTDSGMVPTSGLLALVTFDTTTASLGTWTLTLADPDGVPTDFAGLAANITNGTLEVKVNSAPAGTDKTVTTLEDTAYTLAVADFGFTDPLDNPANVLSRVKITTLPAAGTLKLNGANVNANDFINVADITAGKLVFTPATDANGSPYTSFTFQVEDDGGTANGGVNLDPSPNTLTVNVTSVNDAPAGTNKTVTTLEDTAYTLAAADFGFTDPLDSPADNFDRVEITTLPGAGTLTLDGTAVSAGDLITVADIAAGKLVFTPATDANGSAYASFTFQVGDDGGTANGGVNLDQSPKTLTVNVTSVADVLGRYIFYNNSAWDGYTVGADPQDDDAIAPSPPVAGHGHDEPYNEPEKELGKQALLPGQTASFGNYASYSKGINGVMIDMDDVGDPDAIGIGDFLFNVGNDDDPIGWAMGPDPLEIQAREISSGLYRITIIWPDHDPYNSDPDPTTIANEWLQVTVRPTLKTPLERRPSRSRFGTTGGTDGKGIDTSAPKTFTITVNPPKGRPGLWAIEPAALSYTANGPARAITATIVAADRSKPFLTGAVVRISANYRKGQDLLLFKNTKKIHGSWNAKTGVLTLSGTDTVARHEAALRSVRYQNTSRHPNTAQRTVTFQVKDKKAYSNKLARTIVFAPTAADAKRAGAAAFTARDNAAASDAALLAMAWPLAGFGQEDKTNLGDRGIFGACTGDSAASPPFCESPTNLAPRGFAVGWHVVAPEGGAPEQSAERRQPEAAPDPLVIALDRFHADMEPARDLLRFEAFAVDGPHHLLADACLHGLGVESRSAPVEFFLAGRSRPARAGRCGC